MAFNLLRLGQPRSRYSVKGVLPKWNGTRVCDPQQPGV